MDNRITLALLIMLLVISSCHLICSERFEIRSSGHREDVSGFPPNPFGRQSRTAVGNGFAATETTRNGFEQLIVGSRVLFRSSFGCLYTRAELNQMPDASDRY